MMSEQHPCLATQEDSLELKEMWNTVFQEEPAFLERFFSERYKPENTVILRQDGVIASSLHALPFTYGGKPCRYIVGAATWPQYRRQGMMGRLLSFTRSFFAVPLFLYPEETARAMYAGNGFFSQILWQYDLMSDRKEPLEQPRKNLEGLQSLYQIMGKSLDRDRLSWDFFLDDYRQGGVSTKNGYALVENGIAVEAGYTDHDALLLLITTLRSHGISSLILRNKEPLPYPCHPVPGGMYDTAELESVYIGEQY